MFFAGASPSGLALGATKGLFKTDRSFPMKVCLEGILKAKLLLPLVRYIGKDSLGYSTSVTPKERIFKCLGFMRGLNVYNQSSLGKRTIKGLFEGLLIL